MTLWLAGLLVWLVVEAGLFTWFVRRSHGAPRWWKRFERDFWAHVEAEAQRERPSTPDRDAPPSR